MDQIIEFTPVLTFFVLYTGLLFGAIHWMLKAQISPIKELLTNHITETNHRITETNQKITETNNKIDTLSAEINNKIDAFRVEVTESIKDTNTNVTKLYEILLQQQNKE